MDNRIENAFEQYKDSALIEIQDYISSQKIDKFKKTFDIIKDSEKNGRRVHFTGIGKPSYVAKYGASLFSSIGTPSYFLDATEAIHGSAGQLNEGDVVICISNSGETEELKSTVCAIKNNKAKVIAITGRENSWLDKNADATIFAKVNQEGGPLNKAPRNSYIAESLAVVFLSIMLQADLELTEDEYIKRHPGGSLGKKQNN